MLDHREEPEWKNEICDHTLTPEDESLAVIEEVSAAVQYYGATETRVLEPDQ